MSVNTDNKRFAVFINSKSALYPSTTKSNVVIPFNANLANYDPMKTYKISMTDVLFSNVFNNVRVNYQTLKFVDLWAAGRNKPASYSVTTVQIPVGFYSYDTFSSYINSTDGVMGYQTQVTYTGTGAPATATPSYFGFGSTYAGETSNDIPKTDFSYTQARVWFKTPSLGDMYQAFKSDNTISVASTTSGVVNSGIYAGKYLVSDDETYGLLHMLGYAFNYGAVTPQPIPGTGLVGFGVPIYNRQVGSATQYSFDNTNWGTSSADVTVRDLKGVCMSDFTGLDDLYIHCDQLRTQFLSGSQRLPLSPSDVVAVVPVNAPFGEKVSFVPNFPLDSYLINSNINEMTFRMTNSSNVDLDFNGIDWSLTLYIEELNDESRIDLERGIPSNPVSVYSSGYNMESTTPMQKRARQYASRRN
jgi:hypothetical protein